MSYFWKVMSNPVNNWIKIFLGLIFPVAIYTRSLFLISLIIIIFLVLSFYLSPVTEGMKIDFMYQAVRGFYLLSKKEIPYYSEIGKKYLSYFWVVMMYYIISLILFIISLILLWDQYLLWGSVLYFSLLAIKLIFLTECANASRMVMSDTSWEEL